MKEDLKIASFCNIKNNAIFINGNKVVEKDTSLNVDDFLKEIYKEQVGGYAKFFKMDTASKLGFITAEFLIKKTVISSKEKENIALILSNNSASLDTDRKHQETINDLNNYFPSPAVFVYTLPNISIGEISIRHKIYGENAFFVFEKFNAKVLLEYANSLFKTEKTNNCICGWINVDKGNYEAFMYLVSKEGKYNHKIKNINKLYNN